MPLARTHPASARWERISPVDASNLRVERRGGLPMTVAALALVEAAPLLDPDGHLLLDELREHVEARTARVPRLRQVLRETSWWQGPPAWVDAPRFDIRDHVRVRALPHPGDEAALLCACWELNAPVLDLSRPPWELWLLTGRPDGTVLVACAGALLSRPGPGVWLAAAGSLAAMLVTATLAAPTHGRLAAGPEPGLLRRLLYVDRLRCAGAVLAVVGALAAVLGSS